MTQELQTFSITNSLRSATRNNRDKIIVYLFYPAVVGLSNVCLSPCTQVKDIHPIGPCTLVRVQMLRYKVMGEVEICLETLRHYPFIFTFASLNSPINLSVKIDFPQRWQVTLNNNIIIKKDHFVEVWKELFT